MHRRRSGLVRPGRLRPPRAVLAVLLAVFTLVAGVGAPASAHGAHPYIRGTQTVPVYSYAHAVRESVRVDTHLDSDHDGKTDTVMADIVRPREAARAGLRVPVIMDASPYYNCCGRGNESQVKKYDADGVITSMPLFYDNYFVPRGYAVVEVDLVGTARSTGCGDVGGPAEIASVKAVIDWLNGRGSAHHLDGRRASPDWTNGHVGMIGKSWDGTLANGVAATGVRGLATIVPISAISSWYDYTRLDGVLRAPGYVNHLARVVSGRPAGTCDDEYAALAEASDDDTGNYNAFWARRDYVRHADRVHASVLVAHGLNDQNVFARHFSRWWRALAAHHVPRKLFLHQEGHTDPFDIRRAAWVDTLHHWFDHWLQGLPNGVMSGPRVTVERAPQQWRHQASYPAPGAHPVALSMGAEGTLGTGDAHGSADITDNPDLTETQAVADPATPRDDRLAFLTAPLPHTVHLSGTPTITLRYKATKPDTELTAKLVDYGTARRDNYEANDYSGIKTLDTRSCWGESTEADSACYLDTAEDVSTTDYGVLSRGWTNAAHHRSLTRVTPLTPGRWYTQTWRLQPQDQLLAAGHHLGLVLSLSDTQNTTPSTTGATVTIDLAHSRFELPTAGRCALPHPADAPRVHTGPAPHGGPSAPAADRPRLRP